MVGVGENIFERCLESKCCNCVPLEDRSSGAGRLPKEWGYLGYESEAGDVMHGFAGGLSPKNVRQQARQIKKVVPSDVALWIDAETHLRDDADKFNFTLCETFITEALQRVRVMATKLNVFGDIVVIIGALISLAMPRGNLELCVVALALMFVGACFSVRTTEIV